MRRLTLIRHGLTEGNVRRWYYGALDLPLCEAGQAAVQEAAAGGLYPPYSGERILTSGMLRTEQTLRLIYGVPGMVGRRSRVSPSLMVLLISPCV